MLDVHDLRLADFGQTRPFPVDPATGHEAHLTNHREFAVKKSYISPEFVEGRPFRATQHDLFACGVILYFMFLQQPPFDLARRGSANSNYLRILQGRIIELAREHCTRGGGNLPDSNSLRCEQCSDPNPEAGSCVLTLESAAVITGLLQVAEHRLTIAQLRQMAWMINEPIEPEPDGDEDGDATMDARGKPDRVGELNE